MKRDLDLIRYILITAEAADCPITDSELINAKYSFEEVAFHVELLADKGLIVASVERWVWSDAFRVGAKAHYMGRIRLSRRY